MPGFKAYLCPYPILLILVISLATPLCHAANSPAQIMSRAMLSMMDTMGDLAQKYKRGDNWSRNDEWTYPGYYPPAGITGYPGNYPPRQPPIPYGAPPYYQNQVAAEVDGIWIGQSGEIVLVMYGYFRIYADAETYRDGRYRIDGDRLLMHDPETGVTQEYQYALDSGRMIMRNKFGTLLLFKQLPIPIPPYALIPETDPQIK